MLRYYFVAVMGFQDGNTMATRCRDDQHNYPSSNTPCVYRECCCLCAAELGPNIRVPNVFAHESRSGACVLPDLLGFLPFNAALRIPVSSDREQVCQH